MSARARRNPSAVAPARNDRQGHLPPRPLDEESGVPRDEVFTAINLAKYETADIIEDRLNKRDQGLLRDLRNGAQASIMTAYRLEGDPSNNIPGFIPTTMSKLEHLEGETDNLKNNQNDMLKRLEAIEKKQTIAGRIWIAIRQHGPVIVKLIDWKTAAVCVCGGLAVVAPKGSIRDFLQWAAETFGHHKQ